MKHIWLWTIFMILLATEANGFLGGEPGFLTTKIVDASVSIVSGRVMKNLPERTISHDNFIISSVSIAGSWKAYEVQIDHYLRGEHPDSPMMLELFEPSEFKIPVIFDRVKIGKRYLFFLNNQQPNGSYRLTAYTGALIQLSDQPPQLQGGDILLAEITTVLEEDVPSTTIPGLRALLPLQIPYHQVEKTLKHLTYSSHLEIAALALATRLQYGDAQALSDILNITQRFPEGEFGEVANVLGSWQDQKDLPAIIELTKSPQIKLKRRSVYVLREIGDTTVIPILAKLMLDEDIEVSYQAVMGLARITKVSYEGQESLAPAYAEFPKYRERIIQLWQQKLKTLEKESQK